MFHNSSQIIKFIYILFFTRLPDNWLTNENLMVNNLTIKKTQNIQDLFLSDYNN